jgi:hypothetical protein
MGEKKEALINLLWIKGAKRYITLGLNLEKGLLML